MSEGLLDLQTLSSHRVESSCTCCWRFIAVQQIRSGSRMRDHSVACCVQEMNCSRLAVESLHQSDLLSTSIVK